ncbi:MAG: tyrosinase family protein [Pseudomonadota bacterium]
MSQINRRKLLQSCAIIGASATLPSWVYALDTGSCAVKTRYNVNSPQGLAMLEIYAGAVRKMMDATLYPEGDPRSWLFQWYTHMVRSDIKKDNEIKRVYPSDSANKKLAEQMWSTCHSHSGQRKDFFLPWHRMYVAYFEQIIRRVSGNYCFTLPYWDYTDKTQQSLPEQFRKENDPVWGPLFRPNRYDKVNAGGNVTEGASDLNLECMKSINYSKADGQGAGFCANLDQAPHGALHDDVGNEQGMGEVPWAANDPIFWLHHCNIDRIWASWNFAGGKNPADPEFLAKQFVFATDAGGIVMATVKDVLTIPKNTYDRYLSRPAGSPAFIKVLKKPQQNLFLLHAATGSVQESGPIVLGKKPVSTNLQGQKANVGLLQSNSLFSLQLKKLKETTSMHLLLEGLAANGKVQGAFDIYVHGADNVKLEKYGPAYVGQINFFGAGEMHDHGNHAPANASAVDDNAVSFLLRPATRKLLKDSKTDTPKVTLIPTALVNEGATPSVARISLVAS